MIGKPIVDLFKFFTGSNNGSTRINMESDGTVSLTGVSNYESLVTSDDDLPNRAFTVQQANISAEAFAGGLRASLVANGGVLGGNLALTVQVVLKADSGIIQLGSAGDNNSVVIYASGADFADGIEKNRLSLNNRERHIETGIVEGAVIVSTKGVFGYSDANTNGPISFAPEGYADTLFFVNIFRGANSGGNVFVAAGAVPSVVTTKSGDGTIPYDTASLEPFGLATLDVGTTNGEYRVEATQPVFVGVKGFNDSDFRLAPPLDTDMLVQNRSAAVSSPFANTEVFWYRHNGELGKLTVSPGSPVDLFTGVVNELGDVFILGSDATPASAGTFAVEINGAVSADIDYNAGPAKVVTGLAASTLVGAYTVTGATITNNTTDVTVTDVAHGLTTGDNVRVSNTGDALILPNGDYDDITVIDVDSYTINYVPTGGTTSTADLVDYSYPYIEDDFIVDPLLGDNLASASAQILVKCQGNLERVAGTPTIDTTGLTGNAHSLTMYQAGNVADNCGNNGKYDPQGLLRLRASAGISCFSGADFQGGEATYAVPTSALSQRIPLPIATLQTGNGAGSCIAVHSIYRGECKVRGTDGSVLYTFTVDRDSSITVDSKFKQLFPCAYQIAGTGDFARAGVIELFTDDFLGGDIESAVPISVVMNSTDNDVLIPGGIQTAQDETVHYGITPDDCRAVIKCDTNQLLRKQTIDATGAETWELV